MQPLQELPVIDQAAAGHTLPAQNHYMSVDLIRRAKILLSGMILK